MCCAIVDCAYSSSVESGSDFDRRTRIITGESVGLTFWYDGGAGICGGSARDDRAIMACTSCAAASMFRERSNCSVMLVLPWRLLELIDVTPAIVENCFSSGSATEAAMVSGLAPGSPALTWIVGKSTFGRSLTGRPWYAIPPNTRIPRMTSVVITGRLMKTSDAFMAPSPPRPAS